jgi:predicted GTPase
LPGGHLMTINDWRRAKLAADWAQRANLLYWIGFAFFNPVDAGLRYAASKAGVSAPLQYLQENLVLWFYVSFVERVGHYLIEVNSGRLRVGVTRYLELLSERLPAHSPDGVALEGRFDPAEEIRHVTIGLLGQVKAGKSSLANALLGEQRAKTDVLPATQGVERYTLKPAGIDTTLVLLDTVGYAHTGPKADQIQATREAAQQSDLLLLVLHARNPGRQADVELLQGLRAWYSSKPQLKCPPILAVVTHIDLLSPALEWAPPYDWRQPIRAKEKNIHDALAYVHEQFGDFVTAVVPVCTVPGKVFGVDEALLPVVANLMEEAHGVALLRCLKAETDTGKVRRVFQQLLATGKEAVKIAWQIAKG